MEQNVIWEVKGNIKKHSRDDFEKVMRDMIEAVVPEEGTIHYEWYVGQDGEQLSVYERYVDAAAAIKHVSTSWSAAAERFMSVVDITEFIVYSDLTPEVQALVEGLNPVYMKPVGGFRK